jgi:hypothetical protein
LLILIAAAGFWVVRNAREPRRSVEVRTRIVPVTSPYKNAAPGVAYIGDAACARCHAEIAEAFGHHPMGRSMTTVTGVMPEVSGTVFEVGDLTYSIERRDGRVFHRETRRDKSGRVIATTEPEVRYVLGSGTRGLSFLVERDGGLFQSPIAWYTQQRSWDLAPTYREQNLHFDRRISVGCLFCHANRVEMVDGKPPVFHGLSIGCERCHGPGELHARRPGRIDGKDLTIVNPADLEPGELRESVCNQCHLQGVSRTNLPGRSSFDFRPGLLLDAFVNISTSAYDPAMRGRAVGQVEQMRESLCYRQSGGQLGCISCHDPHRLPEAGERIAYYRGRCLECHADRGCSLPLPTRRTRSPEDDCTACHMPRKDATDVAHTALTDHRIPRRADAAR